jgi:hypothetical protein
MEHQGMKFFKKSFLLMLIVMAFSVSAFAAEEKKADEAPAEKPAEAAPEQAGRFAPDFCDFEITFPEAPMKTQKCPMEENRCYDLYSYTMVYDLQTTVDVSVSCNPSTPAMFSRYNEAVIKAALAGMVDERRLDDYGTEYKETDGVRQGSLTGTGKTGTQDKIYTAQLWIGQNSVFTMQAELIGGAHQKADKQFSDILRSIKVKEGKQLPTPVMREENLN